MRILSADTIVAIATAPLAAGVAVLRLSGPQSVAAVLALMPSQTTLKPRQMRFTPLVNTAGETLDKALVVAFPAPHSFTGEDVVEVHCHGGLAVVEALQQALLAQPGVRLAEAGEFSRRAFANGKMDLTEAEGLADLIAAETEEQRKQALRQMDGELGHRFEAWRSAIMHLLAHVEAVIDFPDEELDVLAEAGLQSKVEELLQQLRTAMAEQVGERLRKGFEVVIVGRPNAGKSTLTNLLTGAETAIVSPIAGTTRDVLESHLNIGGFPIVLADTAGLRHSDDVIEQEGVKRAQKRAQTADITILVAAADELENLDPVATAALKPGAGFVVVSKVDCMPEMAAKLPETITIAGQNYPLIAVNLTESTALPPVLEQLEQLVRQRFAQARGAAMLNRSRHRNAVAQAINHLERALELYQNPEQSYSVSELLAQDLRDAAAAIGSVTGRTGTEDVLDLVFSTFCIGK